jgi:hypothetical protein
MNPVWYVVPSVVALAVLAFVLNRRREAARTEDVRRFARQRGFEYRDKVDRPPVQTRLFKEGRGRRVHNVLSREEIDAKTMLFDYRYVQSGGEHSSVEHVTVAAFRRDGRSFPPFELRPENVFHKIAGALGWRDVDFEAYPDFSGKWLLRGPDEAAIRRVFEPSVLAFFEKTSGWSVETENGWVVAYRAGRRVPPHDLAGFLEEAKRIDGVLDAAARGGRP